MKKRPVYQINPTDLSIIREWESVSLAAQEMNFPQSAICAAAKGKRISANGYYWCFTEEFSSWTPKTRKCKKIICLETGEVFESAKEAAEFFECTETLVRKCCGDSFHPIGRENWHIQYLDEARND